MERLTQASNKGGLAFTFDLDITCEESEIRKITKLGERLKEYEDLEEKGLLLRLPCKVEDTVFVSEEALRKKKEHGAFSEKKIIFESENRPRYVKCKVVGISFKNKGNYIKVRYTGEFEEKYFDYETGCDYRIITDYIDMNFVFSSIGKKVFLTKEEAEQTLKKMESEER